MAPEDVPFGMSPDCQDVEFIPGGYRIRPGSTSVYSAISSTPRVNGLKSYITLGLAQRLLTFTDDGRLFKDAAAPGTLTLIATGLATAAYMKSTTLFGREYIAISNGTAGVDIPRVYNDTNFDRVGQSGPGEGPAVADGAAGNVAAGAHQVAVWFETRNSGWTRLSPPVTWTAAGLKTAVLTNIPLGPVNVTKRLVAFTGAGGARFYHLPDRMIINDNSTTTLTVNFIESTLLSGTNVDYLMRNEVIPSAAGVENYKNRLVWWGEEPIMQGWRNITFDGGFLAGRPLGWIKDAGAPGAGGSEETVDTATFSAYKITGDGASVFRGLISQNALVDPWGNTALIKPNTAYTVKFRAKRSAGLVAGSLTLDLIDSVLFTVFDTIQLTAGTATTSYVEYSGTFSPHVALSANLVFRLYGANTMTNNEFFLIDEIKIVDTTATAPTSTLRISRTFQPDTYDGTSGLINVAEKNGQAIRTCLENRGYLFVIKERSTHVTQADPQNEPVLWNVDEIDGAVGTPSINGAARGEGWFVVANRNGLYYFSGGIYTKVSQEIQPTWDTINWELAGKTIWVQVDLKNKRVLVGAPFGGATQPTDILALDFVQGWADPLVYEGKGRKWTLWNLAMNSCAIVETSGGSQVWLGNNAANGKLYKMDSTVRTDDGVAIVEKYRTAFMGSPGMPSSGLTLFAYLTMYAKGSGNLTVKAYGPGDVTLQTLNTFALANPASKDTDFPINVQFERTSFELSTSGAADWHQLSKFVPYVTQAPTGGSR